MPDEARFDQRFNADAGRCHVFPRNRVFPRRGDKNDLMAAIVMPPARAKGLVGHGRQSHLPEHPASLESIADMRMHDGGTTQKSRE
jgi:hypothetical protein